MLAFICACDKCAFVSPCLTFFPDIRNMFEIYMPTHDFFFLAFHNNFQMPKYIYIYTKKSPLCHPCTSFEVCISPFTNICRVKIRNKHFKKASSMNVNRVDEVVCFSLQSKYEVRTWVNVCVIQESVCSFVVLFAWGEGDYFSKCFVSFYTSESPLYSAI